MYDPTILQGTENILDEGRPISREEIRKIVADATATVEVLVDFERGAFTLTLEEYTLLPGPFFVYRRLLSEFRAEIKKREQDIRAKIRDKS